MGEYHYTNLAFCGFIVWLIIPGLGFLYGGLARRKSALALMSSHLWSPLCKTALTCWTTSDRAIMLIACCCG